MRLLFLAGVLALLQSLPEASSFSSGSAPARVASGRVRTMVSRRGANRQGLSSSRRDAELDDMRLDTSQLSEEEKERVQGLLNIRESLAEVSAIEKQLGLKTGDDDDDDDDKEIEVAKTRWSGQAGMDVTIIGEKNWSDLLRRRGLVVCDLLAISTFAWVGRSSHVSSNLDLGVLLTAAPFYAGWFGISPFLGAYTNEATATQSDMVKTLLPAWALSMPVAIALRSAAKGELPPLPFVAVSMIATGVILTAYRAAYVVINPTSTAEYKKGGVLDAFKMITTLLRRW